MGKGARALRKANWARTSKRRVALASERLCAQNASYTTGLVRDIFNNYAYAEHNMTGTTSTSPAKHDAAVSRHRSERAERFGLFTLFTLCGFFIFGLTMTFVPLLPAWMNYAGRCALLCVFAGLWWSARGGHSLSRFRPVFFAYFAAVLSLSLGFLFGDWGLWLFGLNVQTPEGVAVVKFSSASLIVIGVLVVARVCGENWGSLYLGKGRLGFGISVGAVGAAACLLLALRQPGVSSLGWS